jgi:prepilin-type processing-associated H-X9-DG protein
MPTPVYGPFQLGTGCRFAEITNGLSNTLLVGEKHVPRDKLGVGWWDCSSYNGDYHACCTRAAGRLFPLTTNLNDTGWKFGSLHTQVVQFSFADGHVRPLPEGTDPNVLEMLTRKNNDQVIPDF